MANLLPISCQSSATVCWTRTSHNATQLKSTFEPPQAVTFAPIELSESSINKSLSLARQLVRSVSLQVMTHTCSISD